MKKLTRNIYHYGTLLSALLAVLIAGCSGLTEGISVVGVPAQPPPIAANDLVGMFPGSTNRLLTLAMEGKDGAELWLQAERGNLTAVREIYEDCWEFVNVDVMKLKEVNGTLTGQAARTKDWQGIRTMLQDLGYKLVSGTELAAYYTAKQFEALYSGMFPTILIMPVGISSDYYQDVLKASEGIEQ